MGFGVFGQIGANLADDGGRKKPSKPVLDRFGVVGVVHERSFLQKCAGAGLVHFKPHVQRAFPFGTIDGKQPVALQSRQRLGIVPVHLVDRFFPGGVVADALCDEPARLDIPGFYRRPAFDILREPFGDYVLGAGNGVLSRGD